MKIIIDTNILCQDYFLEKPHFRILFDGADVIPTTIHIPEVVIDELLNRYREDLEDIIFDYDRDIRKLNSLTKKDIKSEVDINVQLDEYKSFLFSKLHENNVKIIDYPKISHKDIVERDLGRKKPFKRNGSGYRDSLIWENVKELPSWGERQVVLITNNSRDFGEGPFIDKELGLEVENRYQVKIFKTLKHFNDEFITPKLKKLEEVKDLLQKEELDSFNIRQWLQDNLLDLLREYDLESVYAGFPTGIGSAYATEIIELNDIKVEDVSQLDKDNKLLTIYVEFDAICSIDSDWEDFNNYQEVRDYWGEEDESFGSISTFQQESINLTVDFVFNGKTNSVDSEELIRIEAEYDEIEFG